MSDFSMLMHGKITFPDFVAKVEGEVANLIARAPADSQPSLTSAVEGLKEGASTLIGLADTGLGLVVGDGADSVATLFANLLQRAVGGAPAAILTPIGQAGIAALASGLKSAIDHAALKAQTALAPPPTAH